MKIFGTSRRAALFLVGVLCLSGFSNYPSSADPAYVPQEPTITRIVRNVDATTAEMTFTAPLINNGPAISDYEYSINGGTTWQSAGITTPVASLTPASRTITISTFGAKGIYDVVLRAVNSNGAGIISPVFNTGLTRAELVGSVVTVPYADEGNALATFAIDSFGVNEDDSADIRFVLASQPSGSNASISTTSTAQGVAIGNQVNIRSSVAQGSDVFSGSATAKVTLSNAGGLLEGTYSITAIPSSVLIQLGSQRQTVSFNISSRGANGLHLDSINTVSSITNSNLVGETQKIFVGARLQLPDLEGTVRLRAEIISFPDGGYVNTTAESGNIPLGSSTQITKSNSNLTTFVGSFSGCAPEELNSLGVCDSVTATPGTFSPLVGGTGIAAFTFTPIIVGSYTLRAWHDANNNGSADLGEALSNIVVSIQNYPGVSAKDSRAVINHENGSRNYFSDEYVLLPMGTSIQKVARIKVTLNSIVINRTNGLSQVIRMDSRAIFPRIRAEIKGPGLIAISENGGLEQPVGRDLIYSIASAATNEVARNEFFIEVWNDGTNGVGVITIYLDEVAWQSKSVSFYGAPSKVRVSQSLRVAPAGIRGTFNAANLFVTDSAGVPVPGVKISAISSDTSFALDEVTPIEFGNGSYGTTMTSLSGTKSGQTVTMIYRATVGTVAVTSDEVVYRFGEKPFTAQIRIFASPGVGEQSFISFAVKDAFGNAPFDSFHPFTLSSSVAISTTLGGVGHFPFSGIFHIYDGFIGTSFRFSNPIIPATVVLSGKLADVEMRTSFTVNSSAEDLILEAAKEASEAAKEAAAAAAEADNATRRATDSANAATDAANAAADKVEALSNQVTEMIEKLKKQIVMLTNLAIKIQKKVSS